MLTTAGDAFLTIGASEGTGVLADLLRDLGIDGRADSESGKREERKNLLCHGNEVSGQGFCGGSAWPPQMES